MGAALLHVGAVALCPHGAPVQLVATAPRVKVAGQPVLTLSDPAIVPGCPFVVATVPMPCLRVQWVAGAQRVRCGGVPALLSSSTGLCLGPTQAPQGAPIIANTQMRVRGT